MLGLRVVLLGAPTSLLSRQNYGDRFAPRRRHIRRRSSEAGQRVHMLRQGFAVENWCEFLCLGCYLAPPRQVGLPRGMRSNAPLPPIPAAGTPPAGPWQELVWQFAPPAASVIDHTVVSDNSKSFLLNWAPSNVLVGVRSWQSRGHQL